MNVNINTIKTALPYLFKVSTTPLIVGTHGVGKTTSIRQFCNDNGYELVSFRLGQLSDSGDITGLPYHDTKKDSTRFLKPDWWPTQEGSKGIIFLDEINRARRDLLQAVFELCEKGTMNGRSLPEGWHVVAAMNPSTQDYQVTTIDDQAFYDRFCVIKVQSSYNDFLEYGNKNGFNKAVLGFISAHPGMLRGNTEDFALDMVKPSDRSWDRVHQLCHLYDQEKDMPDTIFNELISGIVGIEASTAFMAHRAKAEKPVDPAEVLANYKEVQAKIKEQYDPNNYRADLISETINGVVEILKGRGNVKLPQKEADNIVFFMQDMPPELLISLTHTLFNQDLSEVVLQIGNDKRLEEATNIAVKYKEAHKSDTAKKDE